MVDTDEAVVTDVIETTDGREELGLLGATIEGIAEDDVAAEDLIVDEAFEGRLPCRGLSALGGCDVAAEGVVGLFLDGVAERSGTAIGGTGGDSALVAAGDCGLRERDIVRGVGGATDEGAGEAERPEKLLSRFLAGLSLYPLVYVRRGMGVRGTPLGGVGALSIRIPAVNCCWAGAGTGVLDAIA